MDAEIGSDLDLELAAVEDDRDRARRAAQPGGNRRPARAGPGGEGLPDAALVDPGANPGSLRPPEAHVGAIGEDRRGLDRRPDRGQIEVLEAGIDLDRALRVADRHVLELTLDPADLDRPDPVVGAGREVIRDRCRHPHVDAGRIGAGQRRGDRAGGGQDREGVAVGPPRGAQVQDGLAGAVARQLRLGAVGVEDPQLGDVLRGIGRLREQQDAVGADPEVRRTDRPDALRGQLERDVIGLEHDVVVAERLPLRESHRREVCLPAVLSRGQSSGRSDPCRRASRPSHSAPTARAQPLTSCSGAVRSV